MASILSDNNVNTKCQVFTPSNIVNNMLDLVRYTSNLKGKRVLENSCGDGAFLAQIVERYIRDAYESERSVEEIREGLEKDIVAFEIDDSLIKTCIQKLDIIARQYGISSVKWNINCADFLKTEQKESFDFIIGNPPYICYADLSTEDRAFLRASFATCKRGKFDYCYAFIEKSYHLLRDGGQLSYIIPSNFFKNVFAADIRQLIRDDLITIIDFPEESVFNGVLVSPAVIYLQKNTTSSILKYQIGMNKDPEIRELIKESFADKWYFTEYDIKGKRVGDCFKVSNAVATLYNKAFVIKDYSLEGEYFIVDGKKIERTIMRIAASPKSMRYAKQEEFIIFPYREDDNGTISHYTLDEMYSFFPCAMKYLEQNKEDLLERDSDNNAEWFEYGRSQALQRLHSSKLLISTVISEDTNTYLLGPGQVPYAGLFITQKTDVPLSLLEEALASKRFKEYASRVGVRVSGSSKRITARDLENYTF